MQQFKTDLAGRELKVEIGKLAGQANGAVTVQYGNTLVLATAVISKQNNSYGNFLPLMVDYEEKFYAAGKIKGSRWIKREGRPTDEAILTGRMIDRTIRPLFNQDIRRSIQIIVTVFSIDEKNDPDLPASWATSLALGISDIPWQGPVGVLRVGQNKKGEFVINPGYEIRAEGDIDLVLGAINDKIIMLDGGGKEIPEQTFVQAIESAQKPIKEIITFQNEIIQAVGKKKQILPKIVLPNALQSKIEQFTKNNKSSSIEDLEHNFEQEFTEEEQTLAQTALEKEIQKKLRKGILEKNKRPDNRKPNEIRPLSAEVGVFPRTHGSGLFARGKTQVVSTVTLGSPGDEQSLDTMETECKKRFIYHYNFPPYAPGEVKPLRGPSRREIGHGALAERSIKPMMPKPEDFPYTVRVVSEVLSSNGSTSMASACSASMALMDAGVPIKKPVAGIALGLIDSVLLTDIQGPEDHYGEMDLKLVGTKDGLTAWQMDVKNKGIDLQILQKALKQSKEARLQILQIMQKTIPEPREQLSPYAPRVYSIKIPPKKISAVIGSGGKTINKIIDETDVDIDIEETGLVMITAKDPESAEKAKNIIQNIIKEFKIGDICQGIVSKIMDFGAFVKISPTHEGLIRISDLSNRYIKNVEDVVKIGQKVKVKVKNIDDRGRINLLLV